MLRYRHVGRVGAVVKGGDDTIRNEIIYHSTNLNELYVPV